MSIMTMVVLMGTMQFSEIVEGQADGYRLVSALCFYPVCKTLCCLTYYIDIHTVCSCAKYTTKSCGSEFQRYSKTVLDLLIVSFNPRQLRVQVCVFQVSFQPSLILFQHRAGVSSYTSSFDLAQTCVFGKQLLGPILCGSISGAPLLPKLRGQFAEFLNNPSPVGLRIFFLPTCVGLRYGHLRNTHSFSRHLPSQTSVLTSLDLYRNQHPALRLQMCPCA